MHIHKPKPLHGFREILTEVGVIVVGILLALGLEQVVEAGRAARESREAREEVRAEIAQDLGVLSWRRSEEACIDRRLGEIGAVLDAATAGKTFPTVRWIGHPITGPITSFRLEAASQGGRAALLRPQEQTDFGLIYYGVTAAAQHQTMEQVAWARLQGLVGFRKLSPEMVLNLREVLGEAQYANARMKLITARAYEKAAALHIAPDRNGRSTNLTCRPMSGPLSQTAQNKGPAQWPAATDLTIPTRPTSDTGIPSSSSTPAS